MKPRSQASRAAIELIKRFEGYRRASAQLASGRWTIGYGHTKTAREGAEVSEADAEALLIYDLIEVSGAINDNVFAPLTQNQFDALCAFVFNIGVDNFKRSAVLRRLNEGDMLRAASIMEMWRKADFEGEPIVIDALVRRRASEKALFLTPPGGFVPAPTPVLPPRLDNDAPAGPLQPAVDVRAPLEGERAVAERVEPTAPAAEIGAESIDVVAPAVETVADEIATPVAESEVPAEAEVPAESAAPEAIAPTPHFDLSTEDGPVAGAEDEPSATQVAAAALTARLQSILMEDEPAAPEAPPPSELDVPAAPPVAANELQPPPVIVPAEEAPFTIIPAAPPAEARSLRYSFSLTPPPEAPPASEFMEPAAPPVIETPTESEPELFQEPRPFEDFDARRVAVQDESALHEFEPLDVEPSHSFGMVPLLASIGVLGLVLFAAGLFWGFNAKHAGDGLFSGVVLIGWGLGVVGIGCVATAAYFLFERLGGREEQE